MNTACGTSLPPCQDLGGCPSPVTIPYDQRRTRSATWSTAGPASGRRHAVLKQCTEVSASHATAMASRPGARGTREVAEHEAAHLKAARLGQRDAVMLWFGGRSAFSDGEIRPQELRRFCGSHRYAGVPELHAPPSTLQRGSWDTIHPKHVQRWCSCPSRSSVRRECTHLRYRGLRLLLPCLRLSNVWVGMPRVRTKRDPYNPFGISEGGRVHRNRVLPQLPCQLSDGKGAVDYRSQENPNVSVYGRMRGGGRELASIWASKWL